jgi:hypothetical protein
MAANGLVVPIRIGRKLTVKRVLPWPFVLEQMAVQLGSLPLAVPTEPQPGPPASTPRDFFSIGELAARWRCSRGTVYNRLRSLGVKVLDFAPRGKRSRKAVPVKAVLEVESRQSKRIQ